MNRPTTAVLAAALLLAAHAAPAQPPRSARDWRPLDLANTLVVDTSKGRIVVEMRPEFAPKSVERVKLLAREGVYDGLLFHRVLPQFAQTGNPNNRDGGTSSHPDLPSEFFFRLPADGTQAVLVRRSDGLERFLGASPLAAVPGTDGKLRGWGLYCAGVVGMGRQADTESGNSEIFFTSQPVRRLDHDYTVWGRVVAGLDVVRSLQIGEPPAHPDRLLRVRRAADLPPAERPRLEVQDEHGAAFRAAVAALQRKEGAAFTPCDVEVKVRDAAG